MLLTITNTAPPATDLGHLLRKNPARVHSCGLGRLPEKQRQRLQFLHGSLMYQDKRLAGFDAAAVVEVIEHLDPPRLAAFERVLFECAKPGTVVLTTPNVEYNVKWESLPAGKLRHKDHRFEWSRAEFQAWATRIGERFGYSARFLPVGPEDAVVGAPTQMGVVSIGTLNTLESNPDHGGITP